MLLDVLREARALPRLPAFMDKFLPEGADRRETGIKR